ncbi:hypothetical protein BASA60_000131 [Batrachochytrium salamandrivorans]|nr:hypothetical protein BASA60_000131 [Batrachochytrium salamandrivorans]
MDDDVIPDLVPDEPQEPLEADNIHEKRDKKVPVTILTGFLGSGKTTLVMDLLNDPTHGKRIAVILNEFGESAGIDKSRFDYVLLETTGLADPAPIASLFWLDEELQSDLYLDGILTVVDAKHIQQDLNAQIGNVQINEALRQIALADRLIINKCDLVSKETVLEIEASIKSINSSALIAKTERSKVPVDFVLDLHSFDGIHSDPFSDRFDTQIAHKINEYVSTVVFTCIGTVTKSKLDLWLQALLWEKNLLGINSGSPHLKLLRVKGVVDLEAQGHMCIVQGVQELYDLHQGGAWTTSPRVNKFVLIGMGLNQPLLLDSFTKSCLD